jgi:hypothetical protein
VTPGLAQSPMAETTSALIIQRWLMTGEPVDEEYAQGHCKVRNGGDLHRCC